MHEKAFFVAFIMALALSMFYLGGTITGYITATRYCQDGFCTEFCRHNSDCSGAVCCDMGGFGACIVECDQEYIFDPDMKQKVIVGNVYVNNIHTEGPADFQAKNLIFFMSLMLVIVIVGIVYYMNHKSQ